MSASGRLILSLLFSCLAYPCFAMDLPTFDIDSLVYLSTDIVLATVENRSSPQAPSSLIVTKVISGRIQPGTVLDKLDVFLDFFFPRLPPGQNVILFLDRRPRAPVPFAAAANHAPFAIVPSGVLPVDREHRVYRYFQQGNPGPYVLQGAETPFEIALERVLPSEEKAKADARRAAALASLLPRLPTYDQTIEQIKRSETYVDELRQLLDGAPTAAEGQALKDLIEKRFARWESADTGGLQDQISRRATEQLETLQDWSDLLDVYPETSKAGPVAFLVTVLTSKDEATQRRIHAAEAVAQASGWHDGSEVADRGDPDKIRLGVYTRPYATEIHRAALRMFMDGGEDRHLRAACVALLDISDREALADIRKVYSRTRSDELRFSIEKAMLESSDDLYESLPGYPGLVTSSVSHYSAPTWGTISAAQQDGNPPDKVRFLGTLLKERRFVRDMGDDNWSARDRYVLVNRDTGERYLFPARFLVRMETEDDTFVLLDRHPVFTPGRYLLRYEYLVRGRALGRGHPVYLVIRSDESKNSISVRSDQAP